MKTKITPCDSDLNEIGKSNANPGSIIPVEYLK